MWQAYKGSSELIDMAEASIQSLPYHLHLPLVSEFVKLSSSMYVSYIVKCPFSLYNSLYCQPIALDMNYILGSKFYRRRIFYKIFKKQI